MAFMAVVGFQVIMFSSEEAGLIRTVEWNSTPHPVPMAPSRPLGRPSTGLHWGESLPPPPQATEVPVRGGEGIAFVSQLGVRWS